jgi:hypothetical protein
VTITAGGVRPQHLTDLFKGYRRNDEVASKDSISRCSKRSLVEAAGNKPVSSSLKDNNLKGNFQEVSSGIRLETVF